MPNWVTNYVYIGGKPEDVEAFRAKISAPRPEQKMIEKTNSLGGSYRDTVEGEWYTPETSDEGDFSFWNLVSPPEDKWPLYFGTSGWRDGKRYGDTVWNWYEWNYANWGTKWDANVEEFTRHQDGSITYRIETPWSTPVEVWNALAEQHPELFVEIEFEEEQGWGGVINIKEGDANLISEWDIPVSHADYEARDRECQNCLWGDEDYLFPDCPRDSGDSQVSVPELTSEGTPA
jgi:hypothetical protein